MNPARFLRTWWRECCIATVVVAGVFGLVWYLLENPYNQTFGHTVTGVPVTGKFVALTFDDGPNPPYTDRIVDYLHEQKVVATFFVVGMAVQSYPESVKREVEDGDAIGNHSWDHARLVLETRRHIRFELQSTDDAIVKAAGIHTKLFRPPFGARDYAVIQVAHDMGYQVIMWSVPLPRDWEGPSPRVIADRVLKHVENGSIIVLHDGNRGRGGDRQATVEATKLLVPELTARGYRLVTVPQLIALGVATEQTPRPSVEDMGGEP